MKRLTVAVLVAAVFGLAIDAQTTQPAPRRAPAAKPVASHSSDADQTALVKQFCTQCHNDRMKTGGLSLAAFDAAHASRDAVVTERMIFRAQEMHDECDERARADE